MATFSQQLCYDDQNSKMYENIPFFNFIANPVFYLLLFILIKQKSFGESHPHTYIYTHTFISPRSALRVLINACLFPHAGIYSQKIHNHAVSDRVWDSGWRHDHCTGAQQPQAAGKTHYSQRDWDLCQPAEAQQRTQVSQADLPNIRQLQGTITWREKMLEKC